MEKTGQTFGFYVVHFVYEVNI